MRKVAFMYTTQKDNFRKDVTYENPRYFEKLPPQGLAKYEAVIVVGEWPKVQEALNNAGIEWRHADIDDDKAAKDLAAELEGLQAPVENLDPPVDGNNPVVIPPDDAPVIAIPENWDALSWPEQKALAQNFTDEPVISKANAARSIKDELKRREA